MAAFRVRDPAPPSRCGIIFNLCLLGYFKYAGFFVANVDNVFGAQWVVPSIILPIGISFITFQKIAFLVDAYRGLVRNFTLLNYTFFVTFFPQLIAGPITHHSEIMPQIGPVATTGHHRRSRRRHQHLRGRSVQEGRDRRQPRDLCRRGLLHAEGRTAARSAPRPGLPCCVTASSSIMIFPATRTWRSDWPACSVSDCRSISIRPTSRPRSSISGAAGTSRCRGFCGTICTFRSAAIDAGPVRRYVNLGIVMLLGGLWHGANWTFVVWGACTA